MSLPAWATKVTPLSKTIALTMFCVLPILGFVLGQKYPKVIFVKPYTESYLLDRCGNYPTKIPQSSSISWSDDCRHIVWSLSDLSSLWLYTEKTEKIQKILLPKQSPPLEFMVWINNDEIEFRTGDILKILNLKTGAISNYE